MEAASTLNSSRLQLETNRPRLTFTPTTSPMQAPAQPIGGFKPSAPPCHLWFIQRHPGDVPAVPRAGAELASSAQLLISELLFTVQVFAWCQWISSSFPIKMTLTSSPVALMTSSDTLIKDPALAAPPTSLVVLEVSSC